MKNNTTANTGNLSATLRRMMAQLRPAGWSGLFRQMSLVNRFLILQLVWASAVFVLIGAGLWVGLSLVIDQNMDREAQQWAKEFDGLGTRLYVSRSRSLPGFRGRMKRWEELRYVRYLDAGANKVLYAYDADRNGRLEFPLPDESVVTALESGEQTARAMRFAHGESGPLVKYLTPVRVRKIRSGNILDFDPDKKSQEQTKTLGYVEFAIDRTLYAEALTQALYVTGIAISVLFVLALFVGRILIREGLTPLFDLRDPLARLARGERDLLVELTGDRELDAIIDALNVTITAVRERDDSLRRLAEYDNLTGLTNRTGFSAALEREVAKMKHTPISSALFFIDLDQFKYVNDTLGHAAGDRLLKQVAQALQSRMRDTDLIARFGGDEFTVLARGIDEKNAIGLANSLLILLQEMQFSDGDTSLHIHCSIGLTLINSIEFSAQEYLAQADMACHRAKNDGRNCFALYRESEGEQGRMLADMSWSQAILKAVQSDGFVLYFQPIVGKDDKENYEVLLRMKGEDNQLFSPGAFLSSAERFGLMPKIDDWVIVHAIARLAEMCKDGRKPRFFINLSGHVFKDTGTLSAIRDQLKRHKIPAGSVCFEITEQVAVQNLEKADLFMRSLQKSGCQFALDDFGAGFSSLKYIKYLPINYIKIDGSFIKNMSRDPIDQAMVQSFVQIGRTLGKKTIAEYVENRESLAMLQEMGVDFVQGYYLCEPQAEILKEPLRPGKASRRKQSPRKSS